MSIRVYAIENWTSTVFLKTENKPARLRTEADLNTSEQTIFVYTLLSNNISLNNRNHNLRAEVKSRWI